MLDLPCICAFEDISSQAKVSRRHTRTMEFCCSGNFLSSCKNWSSLFSAATLFFCSKESCWSWHALNTAVHSLYRFDSTATRLLITSGETLSYSLHYPKFLRLVSFQHLALAKLHCTLLCSAFYISNEKQVPKHGCLFHFLGCFHLSIIDLHCFGPHNAGARSHPLLLCIAIFLFKKN